MKLRYFLACTFLLILLSAPLRSEPVPDRLISKVTMQNSAKIDAKTKQELSAIAAKIIKSRQKGTIKIKGDAPSAASADEYILKSAIMARNVAAQITQLLSGKYQVFVATSKYSGAKRPGQNSVEIYLYPYELQEEVAGFTSSQVTAENLPVERDPSLPVFEQPVQSVSPQPVQSGLLTAPPDEDDSVEVTSKKERVKTETENPALANELVIRAKARAAERAKRLEQAE